MIERFKLRLANYSAWFHLLIGVGCLSVAALILRILTRTPQSREDAAAQLSMLGLIRPTE